MSYFAEKSLFKPITESAEYLADVKKQYIRLRIECDAAEQICKDVAAMQARAFLHDLKIYKGTVIQVNWQDRPWVSYKYHGISPSGSYYSFNPHIEAYERLKSGKWSKSLTAIELTSIPCKWIRLYKEQNDD